MLLPHGLLRQSRRPPQSKQDFAHHIEPTIVSMACRQRLCCGLLRSSRATPPFSVIRPIRATLTWKSTHSPPQKSSFSTTSFQYAEIIVKVPPMAESISEGTLSSFTKQPGDHVEQDEEIASIETDKVMSTTHGLLAIILTYPF